MMLNQPAIESMGFSKSKKGESITLDFYCCYIYVFKSIGLQSEGILTSHFHGADIFIGNDVEELYEIAMGSKMFVGPGPTTEQDIVPYKDKTCLIIRPRKKFKKEIYDYNSKLQYGVVILYDAFSEFKEQFSALVSPTINRCLFDIKVNYYSKSSTLLDLELKSFDFYGVDCNGLRYLSVKIGAQINTSFHRKFDEKVFKSLFSRQTTDKLGGKFISIYSTVDITTDPFKEYLVTYSSMEEYISSSFTILRSKFKGSNFPADDWAAYDILTCQSLTLKQKFFLVSKFLWCNFTPDLYSRFENICQVRNDLAHRGSPSKDKAISSHDLKCFYFELLSFR